MAAEPIFRYRLSRDGAEDVTLDIFPRDVLALEKKYKGLTLESMTSEVSFANIYRAAYWAARRQAVIHPDMGQQDFEDTYDVEPIPVDPPDPS